LNLEELIFEEHTVISDDFIKVILSAPLAATLHTLKYGNYADVSTEGFIKLSKLNLIYLSLRQPMNLDDKMLEYLLRNYTRLRKLELIGSLNLTNAASNIIANYCNSSLKSLNLAGTPILTDAIFEPLSNCIQLRSLNLRELIDITDNGFKSIIKTLTHLEKLVLFGCGKITDESLQVIAANCPRIRKY